MTSGPTPWAVARARAIVKMICESGVMMHLDSEHDRAYFAERQEEIIAKALDEARMETLFAVRDWLTDEDTDEQLGDVIEALEANIITAAWSGPWPRTAQ
jgi:hypothetical protein